MSARHQYLRDALALARANGVAWLTFEGRRLRIRPRLLADTAESLDGCEALVRSRGRVRRGTLTAKDAAPRVRVEVEGGPCFRAGLRDVLAIVLYSTTRAPEAIG